MADFIYGTIALVLTLGALIATYHTYMQHIYAEIAREEAQFSDPDFFRTRAAEAGKIQKHIDSLKAEYETACTRWEELESKRV